MFVMWQHSSEMFNRVPEIATNGTLLADIAWSVDFGRIGVVCFFLISGFVIPFSFPGGENALKKFAIRRFFRLYPIYWVSIAMALIATFAFSGKIFAASTIFSNISMLQKFFNKPHIQGLYWTLQAEVIFYFLCACMHAFAILHKPSKQFSACILSLIFFCIASIAYKQVPIFNSFDKEIIYIPYVIAIMFSGTIMRTLLIDGKVGRHKILLLIAPLLVFGVPLIVLFLHFFEINIIGQPVRFFFGHVLGLLLFIFGFYKLKSNNPFLLWLGTVSYSIYLFHPVAMKLVYWIIRQNWAADISSLHMSVYMLLIFTTTLIIAFLTYNLIEKHSIELGRRLTNQ